MLQHGETLGAHQVEETMTEAMFHLYEMSIEAESKEVDSESVGLEVWCRMANDCQWLMIRG